MAGHGTPDMSTVDGAGVRLGVVATRWHTEITEQLLNRSLAAAKACGVDDVVVARVAGSVELPVLAQALARRCDAVVALGVVIRGDTAHFEYVCQSVTDGLTRVALDEQTPPACPTRARTRAGPPQWPPSMPPWRCAPCPETGRRHPRATRAPKR
jgi:6,7-dimethyl-8-ribityllumazine synthase